MTKPIIMATTVSRVRVIWIGREGVVVQVEVLDLHPAVGMEVKHLGMSPAPRARDGDGAAPPDGDAAAPRDMVRPVTGNR